MASTEMMVGELLKGATTMTMPRRLFCYASPLEKAKMRIEQFWVATLMRSTNLIWRLLQLDMAGAFSLTADQSVVLDRKHQFLDLVSIIHSGHSHKGVEDVVEQSESLRKGVKTYRTDSGAEDLVVGIVSC